MRPELKRDLEESLVQLMKDMKALRSWVFKRECDSFFGDKWRVNKKTRNFYIQLAPVLRDMQESLILMQFAIEEEGDQKGTSWRDR